MISYFGCVIPDDKVNDWKGTSEASNKFQKRFLASFENNIKSVNSIVSCDHSCNKINVNNIGKVNLIIKPKSIIGPIYVFKEYIAKLITACLKRCTIIQFNPEYYSLFTPLVANLFKVESVLILSDFTESDEYTSLLKKMFSIILEKTIIKYTKIIVLSDTKLVKDHKNILRYRGAVEESEYSDFTINLPRDKIKILYSGYFDIHTGIPLLLEAISKIENSSLELNFSGWGPLEKCIEEYASRDVRIINHGFVKRDKFLRLMKEAHILINPRDMNFKQNQNNFPSKVLEYLASGRVVVSSKFSGYSDFDNYNIFFTESKSNSLIITIQNVIKDINNLCIRSFQRNRILVSEFYISNQKKKIRDFVFYG